MYRKIRNKTKKTPWGRNTNDGVTYKEMQGNGLLEKSAKGTTETQRIRGGGTYSVKYNENALCSQGKWKRAHLDLLKERKKDRDENSVKCVGNARENAMGSERCYGGENSWESGDPGQSTGQKICAV